MKSWQNYPLIDTPVKLHTYDNIILTILPKCRTGSHLDKVKGKNNNKVHFANHVSLLVRHKSRSQSPAACDSMALLVPIGW